MKRGETFVLGIVCGLLAAVLISYWHVGSTLSLLDQCEAQMRVSGVLVRQVQSELNTVAMMSKRLRQECRRTKK